MEAQPSHSKPKRHSDTDIFVGLPCEVCGERLKLSDNSAYWVTYQVDEGHKARGWHWRCWWER